ncbi:hypothetical protein [Streptomyces sp. NPDC060194]|uniref:hypothetical protein n=1 Tax=Streptomyces sp. NPDC060194 TaxID=3347069 RepID=UPI00365221A1
MPRGRHRHSPPLHRLLPPSALAGAAIACAAAAWLFADPLVLRVLVALTAVTAVACAVVTRQWDRVAGKRVADLVRARQSDEWRYEERLAELESDLEEARALRGRLELKLRAKRAELAGLRNEHAALLRRYATAETERATALEKRRLLAIESTAPAEQKALPARTPSTEVALVHRGPTPAAYLRAAEALRNLGRAAARQAAASGKASPDAGKDAAPADAPEGETRGKPAAAGGHAPAAAASSAVPRGHYVVPAAVAVVPQQPAQRPASRLEGGFDFFGAQKQGDRRAALDAVEHEDLADVTGAEALAAHQARTAPTPAGSAPADAGQAGAAEAPEGAGAPEGSEVIDLTEHDETEQLDVTGLRSAIS